MTVRALWAGGRLYEVTGEGYGTKGVVRGTEATLVSALLPFALCNDAHLTDDGFVGDPTDAALVVLAAKAGLDADGLRAELPRTGELPFDAATKYMATFHTEPDGRTRVYVKGAVDVLLGLCSEAVTEDGVSELDDRCRGGVLEVTRQLGGSGLRVLGAATALVDGVPDHGVAMGVTGTDVAKEAADMVLTDDDFSGEWILDTRRLVAISRAGAVMALGTVGLLALARPWAGNDTALTMAFTTFALFQPFNSFNARADQGPLLGRRQLRNRTLWWCLAGVLVVQIAAVNLPWARTVFDTQPLDPVQWALCLGTATTVLLVELLVRGTKRLVH